MNYLNALSEKDEQKKIDELKKIIVLGEKLNKDVTPDRKKLEILTTRLKSTPIPKEKDELPISNIDRINPIQSITTNESNIVVKFNKDYTRDNINQVSKKIANTYEYSFDILGKYKYAKSTKIKIGGIDNVDIQESPNGVNIKISNSENIKMTYSIAPRELIIKINPQLNSSTTINKKDSVNSSNELPSTLPSSITSSMTNGKAKNKIIVLDAGHGADDVGAVGPNDRYEKVVNLNVTKYVASILKQKGYTVYLTRSDDTFIKVQDRTVLANEKNADLFISIHTNAVPKEKANQIDGIETFFLSPTRNERAKRVAALENKSDIREMSDSSKDVFLESLNRSRITASHKFAIDVQSGILQSVKSKYKDINDSGVKEGPFWVLVGAQMPSILVELGYITHPIESKRLYEPAYQQLLASGIANGVDSYFAKNP
jgi:N-acetylmuramoyl-L-alanine amidase